MLESSHACAVAKDAVRLRHAATAAEFLADPMGATIRGRSFAVWVQRRDRLGAIHGSADESRDFADIAALLPLFVHPQLAPRYDILHDLGELRSADPSAFEFFEGVLRTWVDALARRVRRVAIVRPPGLVGAALAGLFHDWVADRLDARLFHAREEAYAWLSMSIDDVSAIEHERAAVIGPTLVRRVRQAIAAQLATATLSSVAAALRTGERTLQRTLQAHGTSVRAEIVRVRIEAAKSMLLACDDKVAAIAQSVGFASNAAFCVAFARQVGATPSNFRIHARGDEHVRRTTDASSRDAKP